MKYSHFLSAVQNGNQYLAYIGGKYHEKDHDKQLKTLHTQ